MNSLGMDGPSLTGPGKSIVKVSISYRQNEKKKGKKKNVFFEKA